MCMSSGDPNASAGQSTAGGAVSGAATGATMGAVAGPWGAAAGAVVGGVMGVIGSNTSRQAAKGSENQRRIAREQQINENRKRATEDYLRQTRLEQLQASQERESLAEKSVDIGRQRDIATGTAVASAAERGVGGRTVDQIVSDYHFQNDLEIGRLNSNQTMRNLQHNENMTAYDRQYYNRATGTPAYAPKQQAPVDYFGPAFSLIGSAAKIGMASGWGKGSTGPAGSGKTVKTVYDGYPTNTFDA